jgi:tRNA (guanine37-N1)-methyltransferase
MRIAYDIIGSKDKSVVLMGVNTKSPRKAAREIMKRHKNVKSVLQKLAERKDVFRLYPCKLILGDKNTEVVHREHGYSIMIDPQKVFFSPREATERQRVAGMAKPKERVLIMFSGAGPYALAIGKACKDCQITCIEINPKGFEYAEKNIRLNRMKNVRNICADVRKVRNIGSFDRMIMPLVETAIDFLDEAFLHSKKGTIIHLYGLSVDKEKFKDLEKTVAEMAQTYNFRYRIVGRQKVLPFAPHVSKVRLDIKVL